MSQVVNSSKLTNDRALVGGIYVYHPTCSMEASTGHKSNLYIFPLVKAFVIIYYIR